VLTKKHLFRGYSLEATLGVPNLADPKDLPHLGIKPGGGARRIESNLQIIWLVREKVLACAGLIGYLEKNGGHNPSRQGFNGRFWLGVKRSSDAAKLAIHKGAETRLFCIHIEHLAKPAIEKLGSISQYPCPSRTACSASRPIRM
jgi:hypothetical protein